MPGLTQRTTETASAEPFPSALGSAADARVDAAAASTPTEKNTAASKTKAARRSGRRERRSAGTRVRVYERRLRRTSTRSPAVRAPAALRVQGRLTPMGSRKTLPLAVLAAATL